MTTRAGFHSQIDRLQEELVLLGSMAEKAIRRSMDALRERNVPAARGIMHDDNAIDEKRFAIEEKTLNLMARQQPLANDLRTLAAVLLLASELERIGDHAEGIAKIVVMLGEEGYVGPLHDLEEMAERALGMLSRALEAFLQQDADLARRVCDEDDGVDALQDVVYRRMLTIMRADASLVRRATYLIWVSHNLERIADRATNICERVVFLASGRMEELNVSVY
ncbi:MAG: phosphate signaling complex protein PhoU [Dehalococcoidia bacterium]